MPSTNAVKLEPFRIQASMQTPLLWAARPALERVLHFPTLNDIYSRVKARELHDGGSFSDRSLTELGITLQFDERKLAAVPATGPLIVVANHPFGGVEGLILAAVLNKIRPDVKLMANYMLAMIPDLRDAFIFVDPFGAPEAARRNMQSIRQTINWVRQGHVLGVFPSGEVSHMTLRRRRVVDPAWSQTVARIVQNTAAPVLPIFFEGRNSSAFQLAGMVHPRLRTLMLPHEMLRRRGDTVRLQIGSVIAPDRLNAYNKPDEMTAYLRARTYMLREVPAEVVAKHGNPRPDQMVLVEPEPRERLVDEVAALPAEQRLVSSKDYDVYIGRASQLPYTLREIGRLRELTFRGVGEGTGKAADLDQFDEYYHHLFVWDREQMQIVGAYRVGHTDEILASHGKRGLYTSTLFHFKRELLEQISPALELGRSFVAPSYQRGYAPLLLLWKGIGAYLATKPRYRYLFGSVSISAEYSTMSRLLMMAFLAVHRSPLSMPRMVRAKNPPREAPPADWQGRDFSAVVRDLNEVDAMVAEVEANTKAMPVLLRQYMKLNAKLLGFNVDPAFGDVLDGLMLVDVLEVGDSIMQRYMGRDAWAEYQAYHGVHGRGNAAD